MAALPASAWVFVDGRPRPGAEARVSVFDRGFLYGDSIYEVTRTVAGQALFLAEHLDRLERSAAGLRMATPPRAEIERAIGETLAALDLPRAYVRVVLTRGAGEISLDPAAADRPGLVVIAKPLSLPPARLYNEGAPLTVVSLRRGGPGQVPAWIKSGNYLTSVLAMIEVRQRGAYEGLMLGPEGQIHEGASSNFFLVRGGRIRTPPLGEDLLWGITRQVVLDLARAEGLPVDEAPTMLDDLAGAEEAFLTSSVRGVMPVSRVDDRWAAPPGPVTRRLMALYGQCIGEAPPC
jgi:branched-chain amino acid aminotransferase